MMLETLSLLNDQIRGAVLARKISGVLSSDHWMSTQSTAYCLLAMAKFARGKTSGKIGFSYRLDNGKTMSVVSGKPVVQIPLPLGRSARSGQLTVSNTGTGIVFARIIMEGIPEAGGEKDFSNNLTLEVGYRNREGESADVTKLVQGTDFTALVSVYNPGMMDYRDLALTQVFPPGWEILNSRISDLQLAESMANPSYQDIRDDRIYTYFNLKHGERKTFVVQLNAAYTGKYYLPGIFCGAMYDNTIGVMKKGSWVEVSKAGD
jgi:hypothetical protein